MTDLLVATTIPWVERAGWAGLAVGVLAAIAFAVRVRRKPVPVWLALPIPSAIAALGAVAAMSRDGAVAVGAREQPDTLVAAWVATAHAGAMRAGWWCGTVAAVAVLLAAWAALPRRGVVRPSLEAATTAAPLGVAALLGVAGLLGVPEAALGALAAAGAAGVLARSRPDEPSWALAAAALTVASAAAAVGADGAVYRIAQLARSDDLGVLDRVIVGRGLALAASALGCAAAVRALVRARSPVAGTAAVALTAIVLASAAGRREALAHGPPAILGELVLPVVRAEPPFRAATGCLVRPSGSAWAAVPVGAGTCPSEVAPGAFGRGQRALVALPADAPAAGLAGWSGPRGVAGALVRLDEGRWLASWRVAQVPIGTWSAPVDGTFAHGSPPNAVLAWRTPDLAAAVGQGRRVDVLFLPTATVGEVLAACAGVAGPTIGCAVAIGDREAWERWADAR